MSNLTADSSVDAWMRELDGPQKNFCAGWQDFPVVQKAHIKLLDQLVAQPHTAPTYPTKRGIVIGAGGAKYFSCGFACFWTLRQLGCNLPVEFWILGEHEIDRNMLALAKAHDIKVVDGLEVCRRKKLSPRILNGWELKPFSVLHSDFEEVMYLDADNIPAVNPEYLFDDPTYVKTGAMFWPDLPPEFRTEWLPSVCWENIGMTYQDSVDFESGQFMINKAKCYKELVVTMWMNEHSDWFYRFVYGDKSTYHLAWRKCETDYAIPSTGCGWIWPAIQQFDMDGKLVFQHACRGKESIASGDSLHSINQQNHVYHAAKVRKEHWSGTIFSWSEMTPFERNIAEKIAGLYTYERVGLDNRPMELEKNGEIGAGRAGCEQRWSVRVIDGVPTVIVIGSAHKGSEIAMFMAQWHDNCFAGKWTAFERCPVTLTPKNKLAICDLLK